MRPARSATARDGAVPAPHRDERTMQHGRPRAPRRATRRPLREPAAAEPPTSAAGRRRRPPRPDRGPLRRRARRARDRPRAGDPVLEACPYRGDPWGVQGVGAGRRLGGLRRDGPARRRPRRGARRQPAARWARRPGPAACIRGRAGTLELVAFDVVEPLGRRWVPRFGITAAPLLAPPPYFRLTPARFWKHRTGGLLQLPSGDPAFDTRWTMLVAEDAPPLRPAGPGPHAPRRCCWPPTTATSSGPRPATSPSSGPTGSGPTWWSTTPACSAPSSPRCPPSTERPALTRGRRGRRTPAGRGPRSRRAAAPAPPGAGPGGAALAGRRGGGAGAAGARRAGDLGGGRRPPGAAGRRPAGRRPRGGVGAGCGAAVRAPADGRGRRPDHPPAGGRPAAAAARRRVRPAPHRRPDVAGRRRHHAAARDGHLRRRGGRRVAGDRDRRAGRHGPGRRRAAPGHRGGGRAGRTVAVSTSRGVRRASRGPRRRSGT